MTTKPCILQLARYLVSLFLFFVPSVSTSNMQFHHVLSSTRVWDDSSCCAEAWKSHSGIKFCLFTQPGVSRQFDNPACTQNKHPRRTCYFGSSLLPESIDVQRGMFLRCTPGTHAWCVKIRKIVPLGLTQTWDSQIAWLLRPRKDWQAIDYIHVERRMDSKLRGRNCKNLEWCLAGLPIRAAITGGATREAFTQQCLDRRWVHTDRVSRTLSDSFLRTYVVSGTPSDARVYDAGACAPALRASPFDPIDAYTWHSLRN